MFQISKSFLNNLKIVNTIFGKIKLHHRILHLYLNNFKETVGVFWPSLERWRGLNPTVPMLCLIKYDVDIHFFIIWRKKFYLWFLYKSDNISHIIDLIRVLKDTVAIFAWTVQDGHLKLRLQYEPENCGIGRRQFFNN